MTPRGPPDEQLRLLVHHFLKDILNEGTDGWHHALMLREVLRPTKASEAFVREVIRPRFAKMSEVVRRLRPDLQGRELMAVVFSIVGQCLHYKLARSMAERVVGRESFVTLLDLDFLTDHITSFTLGALAAGVPKGRIPVKPTAPGEAD